MLNYLFVVPFLRCDAYGATPLHSAAESGCPKTFAEIINSGGDLRRVDYAGKGIQSRIDGVSNKKKQAKMNLILDERLQLSDVFVQESSGDGVKSRLR